MDTQRRPTLTELANRHGSDKGTAIGHRHRYTWLYDLLLAPLRDQPLNLLEIGLAVGGPETAQGRIERRVGSPSVAMWLDYFPAAQVFGFDISDFSHLRHPRFTFRRGDCGRAEDLGGLAAALPALDIVVDDGSHASFHQQLALKHLFGRVKPGGLYIVEDLHWQSPVYETSLPPAPLTAKLFTDLFEGGVAEDGPVFSRAELLALRDATQSFALFPDFTGRTTTTKLLVLRRRADAKAAAPIPPVLAPRRRVRSFDLFDTLVARRCIQPHRIFEIAEQRLAAPGFAAQRIAAEAELAQGEYGLRQIYDTLGARWPAFAPRIEDAMRLELAIERENLFPIAEHVAEVEAGDLVVSDMYLPRPFVASLLRDTAGLRHATLVLTARGKRSGRVWPALRRHHEIREHLGDNPTTDQRSPQAAGIPARLTSVAAPTPDETAVAAQGLPRLAEAMREARLRSWHEDAEMRALQGLQAGANAPMLLLAAAWALRRAREDGIARLLPSSRDCHLWTGLLAALAPRMAPGCTVSYFYTGRLPRAFPSADYADYARRMTAGEPSWILDLCGTGWSLQRLCEQAGLERTRILLIHRPEMALRETYEGFGPTRGLVAPEAIIPPAAALNHTVVELANSAPHPTVLDVTRIGAMHVPVFAELPEEKRLAVLRRAQEEAFAAASRILLTRAVIEEAEAASLDLLGQAVRLLFGAVAHHAGALAPFIAAHGAEDTAVLMKLRATSRAAGA